MALRCRLAREREAEEEVRQMGYEPPADLQLQVGREDGYLLSEDEDAGPALDLGRAERIVKEIQFVLQNFNARRQPGRSRKEYVAAVRIPLPPSRLPSNSSNALQAVPRSAQQPRFHRS